MMRSYILRKTGIKRHDGQRFPSRRARGLAPHGGETNMSEPKNKASDDDLRSVLNVLPEAVCAFKPGNGDGAPFLVNSACLRKMEASSERELLEKCGGSLLGIIHPGDRDRARQACARALEGGRQESFDCRVLTVRGSVLMVRMLARRVRASDGQDLCVLAWLDLGDELLARPGIETDRLTGLLTMHSFMKVMEERRRSHPGSLAVLYIDIVNFRSLNLRDGVSAGDGFLKSFGSSLQLALDDGIAARFDADHFAALVPSRGIEERAAQVRAIARRFSSSAIDAAVGACVWDDALVSAEQACSRAKMAADECRRHENTFFLRFTPQMGRRLEVAEYVASSIDQAISRGWIKVYYQPIIRSLTGQLSGFEALARWDDPARGLLPPMDFIGPLEDAQQIWKLDLYVIRQVISRISRREREGLPEIPVSVNLSRIDFLHCDIFREVESLVDELDIPRRLLRIEITESVMTSREELVRKAMDSFKSAGYELWMDDFGSGYSTLNLLKDCKFDLLKLDMAFLKSDSPRSRAIISSVIAMDKQIGNRTLAEGVETAEQADFLRSSGCEMMQGYLFGRPLPFDESLKACEEKGIGIEEARRKPYYDALGRVDFMKGTPLFIIEQRGGSFRVLFMNEACCRQAAEDGIRGADAAEALANARGTALNRDLLKAAALAVRTGRVENVLGKVNGLSRIFRFMLLSRCDDDSLFEVSVYDSTRIEQEFQGSLSSLVNLRFFYTGLYDIDLESGTVRSCLYADDSEDAPAVPIASPGGDPADVLPGIFPADRQRYLAFIDPRTLPERLDRDKHGLVRGIFRTRDEDGSYAWMSHRILRVPNGPRTRAMYGVRMMDVGTDRDEAALLNSHAYGPFAIGPGDKDALWENLMLGSPLPLFWKDDKHRFLGASRCFLDYYGFSSQSEIIGRTDEDMRWHPANGPFHNDEEEILRTGEMHEGVPGKCISKGISHSILATKWPMFKNGKVAGLMGYFLDEEMVRGLAAGASAAASRLDTETGLPTVETFLDDLSRYESDNRMQGRRFGIILISVGEFRRILASFGKEAMLAAVRACAEAVRREAGADASCCRVSAGQFAIVRECQGREELEAIALRIRSSIGAIRRAGGADCTLFAKAVVVPPGQSEKFRTMLVSSVVEQAAMPGAGGGGVLSGSRIIQALMDDVPIGCCILRPDCTITYWNAEAGELLGYQSEEMVGRKCTELPLGCSYTNSEPIPRGKCPATAAIDTGQPQTTEMFMTGKDGAEVLVRSTLVPIRDPMGGGMEVAALFTPLSDRRYNRSLVRAIYEVATRDKLTGLPGRKYMEVCLEEALESFRRTGHRFAVILADIDDLREINERLGREAGDAVLSQIGLLLRRHGRKSDVFCRWGGDELVGLLQIRSPESARSAAERFMRISGSGRARFRSHSIGFCCSIGIALPSEGDSVVSLIERADSLMFKARADKGICIEEEVKDRAGC